MSRSRFRGRSSVSELNVFGEPEVEGFELSLCLTLMTTRRLVSGVLILTGPGRRWRWSAEEKARIVAETLIPGARVGSCASLAALPAAGVRVATESSG
jgi:hypothetical protein